MNYRDALNQMQNREISITQLAEIHPNCSCERAETVLGGKGPIADIETVSWLLTSANFKIKDVKELTVENIRSLLDAQAISRVFNVGLSVCRVNHGYATPTELTATIKQLHKNLSTTRPNSGGVYGSLSIKASIIRYALDKSRSFCIYETPSDQVRKGKFARPSHADIVWSRNHKIALKRDRIESISTLQRIFQDFGEIEIWSCLETSEYSRFLPKKIKDQLLKSEYQ